MERCSILLTMGQSPPGTTYNVVNWRLELPLLDQGRTDLFGFPVPATRRVYCTALRLGFACSQCDTLVSVHVAPVGDVKTMGLEHCAVGRGHRGRGVYKGGSRRGSLPIYTNAGPGRARNSRRLTVRRHALRARSAAEVLKQSSVDHSRPASQLAGL